MLKKSISYTDFEGNPQVEDFYFNITKTELVELELSYEGGLQDAINKMIASKDNKNLLEQFKRIILMAYGERSEDGKRFVKSKEISEAFLHHAAYDALFMELASDPEAVSAFVKAIVPQDIQFMAKPVESKVQIPPPDIPPIPPLPQTH